MTALCLYHGPAAGTVLLQRAKVTARRLCDLPGARGPVVLTATNPDPTFGVRHRGTITIYEPLVYQVYHILNRY